jgi:hypothetical protein
MFSEHYYQYLDNEELVESSEELKKRNLKLLKFALENKFYLPALYLSRILSERFDFEIDLHELAIEALRSIPNIDEHVAEWPYLLMDEEIFALNNRQEKSSEQGITYVLEEVEKLLTERIPEVPERPVIIEEKIAGLGADIKEIRLEEFHAKQEELENPVEQAREAIVAEVLTVGQTFQAFHQEDLPPNPSDSIPQINPTIHIRMQNSVPDASFALLSNVFGDQNVPAILSLYWQRTDPTLLALVSANSKRLGYGALPEPAEAKVMLAGLSIPLLQESND